jgi:hypothetical protein
MEGGRLSERTLRRLPFALAAVCLATGAVGLAMTFNERTLLVPYQPIDYELRLQAPATAGPVGHAPGADLDGLSPEPEFVAAVTEEQVAPAVPVASTAPRISAAAAGGSGSLAVVQAVPAAATPKPEDPGVVLDATPPAGPEEPEAVPAAPTSSSKPGVSVVTTNTGASLPAYGSRSPGGLSRDQDAPAQTDRSASPTVSPTTAKPTATPTVTPAKSNGNSKKK